MLSAVLQTAVLGTDAQHPAVELLTMGQVGQQLVGGYSTAMLCEVSHIQEKRNATYPRFWHPLEGFLDLCPRQPLLLQKGHFGLLGGALHLQVRDLWSNNCMEGQ